MAATPITPSERHYFTTINQGNVHLYRYELTTIAISGSSAEYRLNDINKDGKIVQVSAACDSDDFDISLRTSESLTPPTTEEILRIIDNNERCLHTDLDIYYYNPADENYLYAYITNNDSGNVATGTIYLDVVVAEVTNMGKTE